MTPAIRPFGPTQRECVLVEWTDSDVSNSTFEGTAREVMRLQYNGRIHPMGDLIFNPTARPGDPDWRVMYISSGDGGSGEQRTNIRNNPQRLDTLVGKILRIIPDLKEHTDSSTVSDNGRYRIPKDNPFAAKPGARKEIWAYGLRNPHRMSWDVDPADRATITSSPTLSDFALGRPSSSFTKAQTTATRCARAPSNSIRITRFRRRQTTTEYPSRLMNRLPTARSLRNIL